MKDPKITRPVGVNKDGYASGGVKVETSSQNLQIDPRSKKVSEDKTTLLKVTL